MAPSSTPTTRELIKELAEIEDRMFAVRACPKRPGPAPVDPELLRLARREEQILAQLRLQRTDA